MLRDLRALGSRQGGDFDAEKVVIGLVVYAFVSRRGILGPLNLLYTQEAIIIGPAASTGRTSRPTMVPFSLVCIHESSISRS